MVVLEYMNKYLPNGNVLFRFSRIHYKRWCNCDSYGSSLILIKGCRISVRADTTYVVSLVAHVVEYFVLNFVGLFVMYLVSVLVVSSCKEPCKEPCNVLCNMCLKGILNDISKKYT